MKTLLLVSAALIFLTFTDCKPATTAVDPSKFVCTKDSPTGGDVYSDGDPKVNMIHIFCGQIKKQSKATGFHCHPGGNNPESAKASDVVKDPENDKEYGSYNTVEVWNKDTWVKKGPRPTTFWPTSMSIPDVVSTVQKLYNSCKPDKEGTVCIEEFQLTSTSI